MTEKKDNLELLGKKVGMTQLFDSNNKLVPVTVIKVGPCSVAQIKTQSNEGYNAVQITYGSKDERKLVNSQKGHLHKAGVEACESLLEFRVQNPEEYKLSQKLDVSHFAEGEKVDIVSTSKGKGFQGVVKRYGFKGGRASHGSMSHRRGGSYGQCQWPGEVNKGKKMPGRMGGDKKTVQNVEIIKILSDENIVIIKGSCPGANGTKVRLRRGIKQSRG